MKSMKLTDIIKSRQQGLTCGSLGATRTPTLADLHKLKFIRAVIKETLRVHHPCKGVPLYSTRCDKNTDQKPVGFNARVPVKDMTLPRGGGRDGKSPVAVLKETQICKSYLRFRKARC